MSKEHTPLAKPVEKPLTFKTPVTKKTGKPFLIESEELKIVPMVSGDKSVPTLVYTGEASDAPEPGQPVSFVHNNGFTYTGHVDEVTSVGGEVLLTFTGELTYTK